MPTSIQAQSFQNTQTLRSTGVTTNTALVSNSVFNEDTRPTRSRTPKPKGLLLPKGYSMRQQNTVTPYFVDYDWFRTNNPAIQSDLSSSKVGIGFSNVIQLSDYNYSAAMLDQAVTKALLALKDQKVNFGQAIGEAGKTVSLVNSLVSDVYKGYRALRKADPKGAYRAFTQRSWKNIPDRWLEYQYGLKPLISDCDGALQHLAQQPVQNYRSIVRGRVTQETKTLSTIATHGFPNARLVKSREEETQVVLAYLPYSPQTIRNVQAGANPAVLAWELTPFSFVLDWALPVGDYLSTFDAAWGWNFLYGCRSQFVRLNAQLQARTSPSGINTYRVHSSRDGSYEGVRFDRSLYSGSPLPMLPRWKNPVSVSHLANGLALLSSLLK